MAPAKLSTRLKSIAEKAGLDSTYCLRAFRYGSWMLTSLFYFLGPPRSPVMFKFGVITLVLVSIKITLALYEAETNNRSGLTKIIVTETFAVSLLLIPTGGIDSPFLWYALNPVLAAITLLAVSFGWIILSLYAIVCLIVAAVDSSFSLQGIAGIYERHLEDLLVFLLVTLAFNLYTRLAAYLNAQTKLLQEQKRELQELNKQLSESYTLTKEYAENITELYHQLEAFCSRDNRQELIKLFLGFACLLTGCPTAVFSWWKNECPADTYYDFSEDTGDTSKEALRTILNSNKQVVLAQPKNQPVRLKTIIKNDNREVICCNIKSVSANYGILAVLVSSAAANDEMLVIEQRISFLATFMSIIFERLSLEELADNLLLNEEQNRIADEIHDTVSQRLFSICFALQSLVDKSESPPELVQQLKFIQKSAGKAAKELRNSIYGLSSRKNGHQGFAETVRSYLDEIRKLNNISLDFTSDGPEELLVSGVRMTLYRVIREAAGNAVKHGKCSHIVVQLHISSDSATLFISDNGQGFDFCNVDGKTRGLGLSNMARLVKSSRGRFQINSRKGEGTSVLCRLPLNNLNISTEVF